MVNKLKKYLIGIVCMLVFGITAYFILTSFFHLPDVLFIKVLGLLIVLFGIIISGIEEKNKLNFFYGRSQTGGSNANSYVVVAVGNALAFSNSSITIFILGLTISIIIVVIVRLITAMKMEKNSMQK